MFSDWADYGDIDGELSAFRFRVEDDHPTDEVFEHPPGSCANVGEGEVVRTSESRSCWSSTMTVEPKFDALYKGAGHQ